MRIGMFSDAYLPDINGVVSSIATLKAALEGLGHTVFVISNHKGTEAEYDEENRILRLPGLELKRMYGYKMSMPFQAEGEEYVRNMELDVIHVHTEAGIGMFARTVAKKLHIPVVYTYHTMYEDYLHYINPANIDSVDHYGRKVVRYLSKIVGNTPQAVIAPSEKTKRALQSYGVQTPIYIVPTGLDFNEYLRKNLNEQRIEEVRQQLHIQPEDHTVVFVGRIAKEKCIEMPIEMMSLTKDPHLKLIIVGGGTDMKYYQNLAEEYGVRDRVIFTDRVDKEIVPYYYAPFDCFVSASVSETQGMTYVEALASQLVVFGRRDEVLENLIDEGETGYYFDSAQELSDKLEIFFQKSKEEREQMGELCLSKTRPYDVELFGQKIVAVYHQAIDDFNNAYRIDKVNFLDSGFVQITVSRKRNDDQPQKLLIPDDDYYDLKLETHSVIDGHTIEDYAGLQEFYKAILLAKRRMYMGDYSGYELKVYLRKKVELTDEEINNVVQILIDEKLIDDQKYALNKAEFWHSMGYSQSQISKKLWKAGIDKSYIQEAIEPLDSEVERANALQAAKRMASSIKIGSEKMIRQNIKNKLIDHGYSREIASDAADRVELDHDQQEMLVATIKKAERLYKSKEEHERIHKVRQYCMRKGFSLSQIEEAYELLEEND